MPDLITVTGVVIDHDGSPVEKLKIFGLPYVEKSFTPAGEAVYGQAECKTNELGLFALQVVKVPGLIYRIEGSTRNILPEGIELRCDDHAAGVTVLLDSLPRSTSPTSIPLYTQVEIIEDLKAYIDADPDFVGPPNTLTVGTVTTGAPGSSADADITGAAPDQTLDLVIPQGDVGPTGPANTLTVGSVTASAPGSAAEADITGAAPNQTLDLVLPRGDVGPTNSLAIGTVTTGAPGSSAGADVTGTAPSQTLDLTIPRGDVGPPNSLSIGTVTTGAPGSAADADITGTAPVQTLDLTIPEGEQGPQGYTRYLVQDGAAYPARPLPTEVPVTFVGSANPDLLGVMVVGDSWINTAADQVVPYVKHYDGAGSPEGVVAAQIGSRYIDVNATRGAVEWIKASGSGNTGWKVTVGDTGWRDVRPLLLNGWTATIFQLRRRNDTVMVKINSLSGNATWLDVMNAPTGFNMAQATYPLGRESYLTGNMVAFACAFSVLGGSWTKMIDGTWNSALYSLVMDFDYQTEQAWPTTLPGTAA